MGTEMIAKATDSFTRKQRRCLFEFDGPSLFSASPRLSVAVVAMPTNGHAFSPDEEYRVAMDGDCLNVIRGVSIVGKIENPPMSVRDKMRGPCPSALGRVVKLYTLTKKAEIMLE
ncbi:MAG: hypothetical protein EA376_01560 [Phycisphaeraceae bacterium]|nr:MAG: hypothetical protein EA376_01560 [Phycisphaeraceae bacterium]